MARGPCLFHFFIHSLFADDVDNDDDDESTISLSLSSPDLTRNRHNANIVNPVINTDSWALNIRNDLEEDTGRRRWK